MAEDIVLPIRHVPLARWPHVGMLVVIGVVTTLLWWRGEAWTALVCLPPAVFAIWRVVWPPEVVVDADGFFYPGTMLGKGVFYWWSDIRELFLGGDRVSLQTMKGTVCWTFRPEANLKSPAGFLMRGAGVDGCIQWPRDPAPEVLTLMEAYRSAAMADAERTLP